MRTFNYTILKNQKWGNDIVAYIAAIHEAKGRQDLYVRQKPQEVEKLVEIAKIQSTETSNAIEVIRTTTTRLRQLLLNKTMPKTCDEEEIAGYRDVLDLIHNNYQYIVTSNYILQLHKILYSHTGKGIGGKFKNVQNNINIVDDNKNKYTIFTPLAPYETKAAIDSICEQLNFAIADGDVDPLILIPIFIHDFLCIHPFVDGNGRMSRLLTTLLLYRSGYFVGRYISLEAKIAETIDLYYKVLGASQIGWHEDSDDKAPFIKYLLGTIISAYRDFEDRMDIISEKLPAIDIVRKAIKTCIGKITKTQIHELCPSLSVSSVEVAIRKMVENKELTKHEKGKNTFYTRTN